VDAGLADSPSMESTFPWPRALSCIGLLVLSNIFMNLAWYGHLAWFKHKGATLGVVALVVLVAWLIALPEYILQVPANRLGHQNYGGPFAAPQLKVIQEGVTLVVFTVIAIVVLKEKPRWTDYAAFVLIVAAVGVSSWGAWKRIKEKSMANTVTNTTVRP
jgi:uncharacterized protein